MIPLEIYPSVYREFRCIGPECRHNCCIGWEVDIDPASMKRYAAVPGAIGEEIRSSIRPGDTPCFRMRENGRCALLREDDLCQIQHYLGEKALSGICRAHPRYRVFLPGRTEIGLGLCCEEAGRMILLSRDALTIPGADADCPPETRELLAVREKFLRCARNRRYSIGRRMMQLHALARVPLNPRSRREWCAFLRSLTPLENEWGLSLDRLEAVRPDYVNFERRMRRRMTEYEQMLVYFLLRHLLADGGADIPTRATFAVWSVGMLYALGAAQFTVTGEFTQADQVELCRMWSANVEYCDENMERCFDLWR